MCSEIAIKVENLGKCYPIYDSPRDRLKQFLFPLIRRLLGLPEKNHYRPFWALQDLSFEIRKAPTAAPPIMASSKGSAFRMMPILPPAAM